MPTNEDFTPRLDLTENQRSLILTALVDLLVKHKRRQASGGALKGQPKEIAELIVLIDQYQGELVLPPSPDSIYDVEYLNAVV